MSLKDRYAIVGVGHTKMGKQPELSNYALQLEAVKHALDDAGLRKEDVDGVITHSHLLGAIRVHHQHLSQRLGIDTSFGVSLSSGGATSCLMVQMAALAIEAGFCHTVLCVHGDKSATGRASHQRFEEFGPEFGNFGAAAEHAFGARRHMHEYGTTHDQLGAIAVAFRKHAVLTPHAQMREPITLEDYHRSRWIVEPFHLLDCCLTTDGAAAVVVTSAERARSLRKPLVYIMGMGQANNSRGFHYGDHMTELAAKESGAKAFRMAGITPADIDTAQLY
ncbi:MAG: thiolase family protein, partial [Deltaproteobacteria bacterium]|nr:thiolase family protein [Deltaproteobacteria bacterium]